MKHVALVNLVIGVRIVAGKDTKQGLLFSVCVAAAPLQFFNAAVISSYFKLMQKVNLCLSIYTLQEFHNILEQKGSSLIFNSNSIDWY